MGDLARLQPAPALDLQALVSPEEVDGVVALPRGPCSGELFPRPATIDLGIHERAHLAVQHLTSAIRDNRAPGEIRLTVEPKLIHGD